jgi:hypothetical protein
VQRRFAQKNPAYSPVAALARSGTAAISQAMFEKCQNDGSFSATLRCIFLPGVSPPAKIRLDWRKNLSPLGILPFIKQSPEKFENTY